MNQQEIFDKVKKGFSTLSDEEFRARLESFRDHPLVVFCQTMKEFSMTTALDVLKQAAQMQLDIEPDAEEDRRANKIWDFAWSTLQAMVEGDGDAPDADAVEALLNKAIASCPRETQLANHILAMA